jgi:predicted TIM-barrel fold metal-dependent hydrolase
MSGADANCLIGHWPFRKLYKNTFEDLKRIHGANDISGGYISSMDSIFYNDPFEGDEELHEIIKGTCYRHVLTINPLLPGFTRDVENGIKRFHINGVRIYPGYHEYALDDRNLKELCHVLKDTGLPLFITLRMEDERLSYLAKPRRIQMDEIRTFLADYSNNKVILLTAFYHELTDLKESINNHKSIWFDTSGLKDQLFTIEKLMTVFSPDKMVFGSLYPLYNFSSTYLAVKHAQVDDSVKQQIMIGLPFKHS